MTNGCICCTLREDLLIEVSRLAREGRFDYLLIESTGISEPLPVAETFTFEDEDGNCLGDVAELDTMVTVVDGAAFLRDFEQAHELKERGIAAGEADERTIADLLVEQVEFANVIVINKCDLIGAKQRERLEEILRRLNPDAKLVSAQHGRVPIESVLGTGLFDFDKAAAAPGWLKEMRGTHVPETEEYGIRSFVYRAQRPFHPQRFHECLNREWKGVLRSKGFFWLASQPDVAFEWAQAGGTVHVRPAGTWWACQPRDQWPDDEENRQFIAERWSEPFGDRRQEIVVIGIDIDKAGIKAMLDSALLDDVEMSQPVEWQYMGDRPFRVELPVETRE